MSINLVSDLIIRVAKQEILPRFKNLDCGDIIEKSPGDTVSIADFETEKILSYELSKHFPDAVIAGEEGISEQPELLNAVINARRGFLIDPIDGTNNFIKGDERFAVMLTEMRNAEVVAAWIYHPPDDRIAVSEKAAGTYINGKKVVISIKSFNPAIMTGAAHIKRFPEEYRTIARNNLGKFGQNRPAFCAGYDYISLVEGRKDFSVYYRTLPWDHLPGCLLYTEAGGYVRTLLDEGNYGIQDQDKGLLSAADKQQWHDIREMIFPGCF